MARAGLTPIKTTCEENGGTWVGAIIVGLPSPHVSARPAAVADVTSSYTGTCTYPAGNSVAVSVCGADYILTQNYDSGDLISQTCTFVGTEDPGYGYGLCEGNDRHEGASNDSITLTPCGGQNGSVTFNPGACVTECTVGPGLPSQAKKSLPSDAIATLYVRLVGEDGQPSNNSYTACFDNPDGDLLTLYRFVSGEWRALVTSSGDPICASASGDGAFYIGPAD